MDKLSAKLPGTLMVGKDGFSPLVEVSEIAGGHRVTVTDVRGVKTFDVLNGQDAKSAYDYAVEGGYTGDSAAFSEALLKALTTDKTFLKAGYPADSVAVGERFTEVETELTDLRIGHDGTAYPTAGDAVRKQIKIVTDCFEPITEAGINRLNISAISDGYYINPGNGNLMVNTSYFTSDYIPVTSGEVITYQYGGDVTNVINRKIATINFLCAYDSSKTRVADACGSGFASYTVPDGVCFIRISVTNNILVNPVVAASAELVPFEDYYVKTIYRLNGESHNDAHIREVVEKMELGGVSSIDEFPDMYTNAFDKDNTGIEAGKFVWNGAISDNLSYFATGFIAVEPDTDYGLFASDSIPAVRSVCEYDKNQGFISGKSHGNVNTIHTTANTHFLRISCYNGAEQSLTVRKGALATGYTPRHSFKIPGEQVGQDATAIDAYLPKHIYCAVGRTIELYNNQVCLQADKYHMKWLCSVGKTLKRKFSITGTETLIGDHTLKLGIYNDKLEEVWAGSTTLHVVAQPETSEPTIVPIGDSLSNSKAWLPEVVNLSDGKVAFAGSYNWTLEDAGGTSRTGGHEGRSGFTAQGYMNGATYSYGGETTPHVFWDGEKFSWAHYLTEASLAGTVDGVMIFLGTNGISNDNTSNAGYIKQMVDAIRADDADIKIFVCNTIYRSNQNGIGVQTGNDGYAAASGVWKYNEDKKVMDLMKKLDALVDSYDKVYMVNLALTHDSEHNFGSVETAVNPRATQKELMPIESVHPQAQGYYQMADVMYSVFCGAFAE